MTDISVVTCAGVVLIQPWPTPMVAMTTDTRSDGLGLPKGHVEVGERFSETALRELNEETGIRTQDVRLLLQLPKYARETIEHDGARVIKRLHYFLGILRSDIQYPDSDLLRWIAPEEVEGYLHFDEDKKWASKVLAFLSNPLIPCETLRQI